MTESLRFCFVTTFYPPYHFGGDAVCAYRLAQALAHRGHRVDVIHSVDAYHLQHPGEPDVPFEHHPNVRLHALRSKRPGLVVLAAHQLGRPAIYGRRIAGILAGNDYDVIHYHNISLMGGPGVLRLGRAVKLYTAHEYWLICATHVLFKFNEAACTKRECLRCTLHQRRPPQLWRATGWLDRCVEEVDAFIMLSQFAIDRHREGGLKRPMVHLPHFIPMPGDEPGAGAPPPQQEPYFLFVGRLEKLKGVQDLLTLFAGYSHASLLIAGDGIYRAELERQAQGLRHVKFLGAVHPSRLGNLYRHAIAVLVPSLCYESFCLIPQEALVHGTPAIVRRIGALTEVVERTGGGLGFDTLDECRDAMERLRTQPELRSQLAARGQETVRRESTEDVHVARYMELVRGLMARRKEQDGRR